MIRIRTILASLLLFGLFSSANAALIDNGSYTSDTQTGLDWLDLTETQNKSYDYVSSQLGTGGLYAGYAYATSSQFYTLVSNYTGVGAADVFEHDFTEGADSIDPLVQLLGNTNTSNSTNSPSLMNSAYGLIADQYDANTHWAALIYDRDEASIYNDFSIAEYYRGLANNQADVNIGSYLVRQTASIPESPSIFLLALGLLGLFGVARRKV